MKQPQNVQPEKLLYNRSESAAMMGVCEKALQRAGNNGELRFIRIAQNCIRYTRADLEAWMQSKAVATNVEASK